MRRLLLALALVLVSVPAWAAVAYDNASSSYDTGNVSSTLTISHTLNSVTNGYAIACAYSRHFAAPSTVAYNGSNMANLGLDKGLDGLMHISMWGISTAGMATGAHNLVITWTGANTDHAGGIISFTGVNQSTPTSGATELDSDAVNPLDVTITSSATSMVASCAALKNHPFASSGDTERWRLLGDDGFGGSTAAGAASVNMDWDQTPFSDTNVILGISVDPVAGTVRHRVTQ